MLLAGQPHDDLREIRLEVEHRDLLADVVDERSAAGQLVDLALELDRDVRLDQARDLFVEDALQDLGRWEYSE